MTVSPGSKCGARKETWQEPGVCVCVFEGRGGGTK